MKNLSFLLVPAAVLLIGCSIPLAKPPNYELAGSSLVITLSGDVISRTIAPTLDMSIASFDIVGTGPDSDSFSAFDITGSSFIEYDLTPGSWTVTVTAKNSLGTDIASDTELFTIVDNQTTVVNIEVVPFTGTGDLNLALSYPTDVTDPVIEASLTPDGGTPTDLTFTVGATSASYSDTGLADGYYILLLRLFDNTDVVWGMMETVRILDGQITTGTWALTATDINAYLAGTASLDLGSDLQNPLDITFGGLVNPLTLGDDMTVTTTLDPVVTADSYQWYLNGEILTGETASSIIIGSALAAGNYRLDVLVDYGETLSSDFVTFSVQ